MRTYKAIEQIEKIYVNKTLSIEKWKSYTELVIPNASSMFLEDIQDYDFNLKCLPILNNVFLNRSKIEKIGDIFDQITQNLESNIISHFQRFLDVEIILYLGLCNGAGWVTDINGRTKVLLGIEKIIELNWDNMNQMLGLIYHELGLVYQKQFGVLERTFNNLSDQFLWQLFTEGVAMNFEQMLVGDFSYYHQDDRKWQKYYDYQLVHLKKDL
jgi:hypothetical protein